MAIVRPVTNAVALAIAWSVATLALGACASPGSTPTVWVVNSLTRVQPTDLPGPTAAASLKAARNEYEAFQVVIRAPRDASLSQVNVSASDLVGPGVIPASRIALYRAHYVQVTTRSPTSPYPAGWWPDALIPFTHPETGKRLEGRFPGAPFPVAAGRNQPVWVEVYVPPGTLPGTYRGQLTITTRGKQSASIPVELTVWNFTLPPIPALQTWFGNLDVDDPVTSDRYLSELVRHRVSPVPGWAGPVVRADGSIDTSASHTRLTHFLERATTWTIPFWPPSHPFPDPLGADRARTERYLHEIQEYLRAHGWLDRAILYLYDEPDNPEKSREAKEYGRLVRKAAPDLRTLVTTPIRSDFLGLVKLWVSPFNAYDATRARARQAQGEEAWSYTALVSGPGYPSWQLDYPLFHYRIAPWINWSVGATGLLYWATNYWAHSADPWTDPASYPSMNGDGALLYPGAGIGYAGPVASLRLKAIRDGIEDYDMLRLLARVDPQAATTAAAAIGRSFTRWTQDPADILEVRARIGEQLHAAGQ